MNSQAKPSFMDSDPAVSILDLGRERIDQHFSLMMLSEAETLEGVDIEALHIMRVASRRLRVAISVFGKTLKDPIPSDIQSYLRETGHKLGAVRDFDVLLQIIEEDLKVKSPEERAALQDIVQFCERERSLLRREMVAHINSEPYRQFKDFFRTMRAQQSLRPESEINQISAISFARAAIRKKQRAVLSPDKLSREIPIESLHRIRIAIKKLRYTVEFFMEPLALDAAEYLERLRLIQDQLGMIHDIHYLIHQGGKMRRSENLASVPPSVKADLKTVVLDRYLQEKTELLEEMIDHFLKCYKNSHIESIKL